MEGAKLCRIGWKQNRCNQLYQNWDMATWHPLVSLAFDSRSGLITVGRNQTVVPLENTYFAKKSFQKYKLAKPRKIPKSDYRCTLSGKIFCCIFGAGHMICEPNLGVSRRSRPESPVNSHHFPESPSPSCIDTVAREACYIVGRFKKHFSQKVKIFR